MLGRWFEEKVSWEIVRRLLPEVVAEHYNIDPRDFSKEISMIRKISLLLPPVLLLSTYTVLLSIMMTAFPDVLQARMLESLIGIALASWLAGMLTIPVIRVYVRRRGMEKAYAKLLGMRRFKSELIALTRMTVRRKLEEAREELTKEYEKYLKDG